MLQHTSDYTERKKPILEGGEKGAVLRFKTKKHTDMCDERVALNKCNLLLPVKLYKQTNKFRRGIKA